MLQARISHIINPVKINQSSDLFIAQPITFESIRNAKGFAEEEGIEVGNYSIQYEEDVCVLPEDFKKLPNLTKSALDYFQFNYSRKLPLIRDLLKIKQLEKETDFYIYTNVDIGLMPHFYITINYLINNGYDAIVINRRTVSNHYQSLKDLPLIYSDIGKYHKGIDCFVFSKNAYQRFNFERAFIGAGAVGLAFVANMITYCDNFIWLEHEHLTFHIGDDRSWKADEYKDYRIINNTEVCKIVKSCLDVLSKDDLIRRKTMSVIQAQLEITINQLKGERSKHQLQYKAKDYIRWYSKKQYEKILEEEPYSKKRFSFFKK